MRYLLTEFGWKIACRMFERKSLPVRSCISRHDNSFFFSVYVDADRAPRQVWLDGRKLKKVKEAKLDAGADTDFQTAVWCVTDDGCRLRLPDDGLPHVLELR